MFILGQQSNFTPSVEQQATMSFFKNFVLLPRSTETMRGFPEVAAPKFGRAKEDSPLYLATEAVATSMMANWPGRRHLKQLAARLDGRSLAATQKAIHETPETSHR